jgi:hypothetical protein
MKHPMLDLPMQPKRADCKDEMTREVDKDMYSMMKFE